MNSWLLHGMKYVKTEDIHILKDYIDLKIYK